MQAFFFLFVTYLILPFYLMQVRYCNFYIRFETVFLEKKELATRKIGGRNFFYVISIEHVLTNLWLLLALMQTEFNMMAIFFIAMYHSTFIFRKTIKYYALAWWLDRIIILSGILILICDYYGFKAFRNLNWKLIILFSICFFLITFTTYLFKQLYNYGKKSRFRLQEIFKRSRS